MDIKKINIRKNSFTLTSLVVMLVLVIGLFIGMFNWWNENAGSAEINIDSKYSDTKLNLTATQTSLENNVNDIKDNLNNIKEADNTFQVAWNGLKGLGNTLKLPISLITTGIETYTTLELSLDYIPNWVKALTLIGITAIIVFLILSILKGDPKL